MPEYPNRHELHTATAEVAQWLYDAARVGLILDDTVMAPTVASQFGNGEVSAKSERYALGAVIGGLIAYHTIEGDGPTAKFVDFHPAPHTDDPLTANPYHTFETSLQQTFRQAENRLAHTKYEPVVRKLEQQYDATASNDLSVGATRRPVGPEHMGSKSEGPFEAAALVHLSALAIARADNNLLQDPVPFIAHQLTGMSMSRAALNVTDFRACPPRIFSHVEQGQSPLDFNRVRLVAHGNGSKRHYMLDLDRQSRALPDNHPWLQTHPRLGHTVKCLLGLVKLEPEHRYSALQNFLHAAVNQAYSLGLYDSVTALLWADNKSAP
jgi:hypothetical protein